MDWIDGRTYFALRRRTIVSCAVAPGASDRAVFSQSPCIIYVDQMLVHGDCGSKILVRSSRRIFPQKISSVATSSLSYLRGPKTVLRNLSVEIICRVKRTGLTRITREKVKPMSRHSAICRFEVTIMSVVKVLSCGAFLQGNPKRAG